MPHPHPQKTVRPSQFPTWRLVFQMIAASIPTTKPSHPRCEHPVEDQECWEVKQARLSQCLTQEALHGRKAIRTAATNKKKDKKHEIWTSGCFRCSQLIGVSLGDIIALPTTREACHFSVLGLHSLPSRRGLHCYLPLFQLRINLHKNSQWWSAFSPLWQWGIMGDGGTSREEDRVQG